MPRRVRSSSQAQRGGEHEEKDSATPLQISDAAVAWLLSHSFSLIHDGTFLSLVLSSVIELDCRSRREGARRVHPCIAHQ